MIRELLVHHILGTEATPILFNFLAVDGDRQKWKMHYMQNPIQITAWESSHHPKCIPQHLKGQTYFSLNRWDVLNRTQKVYGFPRIRAPGPDYPPQYLQPGGHPGFSSVPSMTGNPISRKVALFKNQRRKCSSPQCLTEKGASGEGTETKRLSTQTGCDKFSMPQFPCV